MDRDTYNGGIERYGPEHLCEFAVRQALIASEEAVMGDKSPKNKEKRKPKKKA